MMRDRQPPDLSGEDREVEYREGVEKHGEKEKPIAEGNSAARKEDDSNEASSESISSPKEKKKATFSSVVARLPKQGRRTVVIEEEEGGTFSMITSDVLEDAKPLWIELLVGRFVDKAPPLAIIHKIVNKIWKYGRADVKIEVFKVGISTVKFRIKHQGIRAKVLSHRSWHIAGVPMVLDKWAPKSEMEEEVIKVVPIWVTMKNIPRSLFHDKGFWYLASRIGEPKKVHMDTELCAKFDEATILVEVNLQDEFPTSHRFRSVDGLDVVIDFEYPWVPYKCELCSKWGHTPSLCRRDKVTDNEVVIEKAPVLPSKITGDESSVDVTDAATRLDLGSHKVEDVSKTGVAVADGENHFKDSDTGLGESIMGVEKSKTDNPLFERCGGDEQIDELGWEEPRSPTRRQIIAVEDLSIVSPTQFDCLKDTMEDGEIRVEEVVAENRDKLNVKAGRKDMKKSDSDIENSRTTRASSKNSRGAISNWVGGRGRGKKHL